MRTKSCLSVILGLGVLALSVMVLIPSQAQAQACDVLQAQLVMQQQGYILKADGVFGPQTAKELMKFQLANGLPQTGRLDVPTCNFIAQLTAPKPAPAPQPAEPPVAQGMQSYPGGCTGGRECGGMSYMINLPNCLIERIEFYADDNLGDSHGGIANVTIDGKLVASGIDIKKAGSNHVISYGGYGQQLQIMATTDDEIRIHYLHVFCR